MATTTAKPPTRTLRCDQRGMIMVVGIVMGLVLVSALLFLLDLGSAIVARERLQDAADSAAFQSAVWHARGMNIIALLNMLMAAILVIIVAVRMVELIVIVILIVCHFITAPTGIGEAVCAAVDTGTLTGLIQLEIRISRPVKFALTAIHYAEVGLAVAIPFVATGRGLDRTRAFYRDQGVTDETNVYSLAQLPTHLDLLAHAAGVPMEPRLGSVAAEFGLIGPTFDLLRNGVNGGTASAFLTEGTPSLPVEKSGPEQLCSRTGELIATSFQSQRLDYIALQLIGPRVLPENVMQAVQQGSQLFRMGVGDIFGMASPLLCEPLGSLVNRALTAVTGLSESWVGRLIGLNSGAKQVIETVQNSPLSAAFLGPMDLGAAPAALWSIAPNGSVFLRTYASSGRAALDRPSFFTENDPQPFRAIASAEYYASCYKILEGWEDQGLGGALRSAIVRSCEDDAMWRIGWSARMRRVRPVVQDLNALQIGQNLLTNRIAEALPGFLGDVPSVSGAIGWVFSGDGSPAAQALEELFGPILNQDTGERSLIIH